MKSLIITSLVLNLIAFITSETIKCSPIAKCDSDDKRKNICISLHSNTTVEIKYYNISKCIEGYTCQKNNLTDLTDSSDVSCISIKGKKKYVDGEECYGDDTCFSGNCGTDHYCVGKSQELKCTSNEECGKGLFCYGNKCAKLREIGGVCSSDFDCAFGAGCTIKGKCQKIYSLKKGDITDGDLFCESGYSTLYKVEGKSDELRCAETKLEIDNCKPSGYCTYTISIPGVETTSKNIDCQCSLAHSDDRFCSLDTQNPIWIERISILKLISSGHTSRRYIPSLMMNHRKVKEAQYYPLFKDVEQCVIDLYLSSNYFRLSLIVLFLFLII